MKNKPVLKMKKFVALLMKEKQPRMNGKMMTLAFFQLYTLSVKDSDNSFSIIYWITCLNKATSVVLQVINIWTS